MRRSCGRQEKRHFTRRAFTLMEVLLVLAILGVIIGLVVPNLLNSQQKANMKAAQAKLHSVEQACEIYAVDHEGDWPTSLESLMSNPGNDTKWNGPYLKEASVPTDPWGSPIQYQYPGQNHAGADRPDIWALGKDKQSNTQDDITNWKKAE